MRTSPRSTFALALVESLFQRRAAATRREPQETMSAEEEKVPDLEVRQRFRRRRRAREACARVDYAE